MRKMVMAVYNEIEHDGRVQRAAVATQKRFDVVLVCRGAGPTKTGLGRVRVIRVMAGARHLPRSIRLLAFWVRFIHAALKEKPSVVYAHDYYMLAPGWLAARLAGARLIYDAHELIVIANSEHVSKRQRFFASIERVLIHKAHLVIAANQQRAEVMARTYELPAVPTVVRNVPRPTPTALSSHVAPIAPIDADIPTLVYQGDVNLGRGIARFIDAVLTADGAWEMLIIGGGPDAKRLRERSQREGWTVVHFVERIPNAALLPLLERCDVGLVCYSYRGLNNILCAPNKVYEYARAGLPMIGTNQAPIKDAVERYGIGVTVGPSADSSEILRALQSMHALARGGPVDMQKRLDRFLSENTWQREATHLLAALSVIADP